MARQKKSAVSAWEAWPKRAIAIFVLILFGVYALVFFTGDRSATPKLGIDLQGGTRVTLVPQGEEPTQDQLNQARVILENRVNGMGVTGASVVADGNTLVITVPGEDVAQAQALGQTSQLLFRPVGQAGMPETFDIVLDPASLTFAASGDGLTKTVTVATQGTGITTETTADCAEWLAAAAEGNRITVTAAINYGGERSGRITVRNTEGASAPLEVTQKAAGDDGIALEPRKLTFGPEGGSKNCAIVTEGTGLTAETDAGSTAWLAASAEGALLTVSVAPWDGSGLRSGTVTVRNAEGGEAVLAIEQSGTETADLSGTWQWSSRCTTDEGWEDAVTVSGTAFVVRDGDGYTITGIAGAGIRRLGATEPEMHLVLRNGRAGISYGEAFEKDGIRYYSAAQLSFPSGIIKAWTATETFAEITVEETTVDGRRCERMTLPDLLAADSALFPDKAQLWGETGEVCYIYYETMRIGGSEIPVPIEYHRNIVLTRECP